MRLRKSGLEITTSRPDSRPALRFGSRPTRRSASPAVYSTGADDYVVVGRSMTVYFTPRRTTPTAWELGTVEEGAYVKGAWVPGRRLNGDETPEWKALRFLPTIRHPEVKLYRYR